MTIYGLQYRPAPYAPTSTVRRLAPIVRLEFGTLFRSKWGVALFLFCLYPSVGQTILLLIRMQMFFFVGDEMPREMGSQPMFHRLDPLRTAFYVEPYVSTDQGLLPFLLLTALVTARAIAKDKTTNALELYWTRGITPFGYFAAKWFGSFLLVAMTTVAAPFALWLTGAFLWQDWTHLETTWRFMPQVLASNVVFTAILTAICTLLSALAGSPNLAMIMWCLLLGVTAPAGHIMAAIVKSQAAATRISVWEAAAAIARAGAGIPQHASAPIDGAILLGILGGILLVLVRRKLRLQEAVG